VDPMEWLRRHLGRRQKEGGLRASSCLARKQGFFGVSLAPRSPWCRMDCLILSIQDDR